MLIVGTSSEVPARRRRKKVKEGRQARRMVRRSPKEVQLEETESEKR